MISTSMGWSMNSDSPRDSCRSIAGAFQRHGADGYPLVISKTLLLKMTIEILDLAIENDDFP